MDRDSSPPRATPARRGQGQHPDGPQIYHQAVAVLQAEYGVDEPRAYRMLVEGSAASGQSVRETAAAIVAARIGAD